MEDNSHLALWAVIWVVIIGVVVASRWRKGAVSVGLPFAFLLNLWLNHWPAAVIYLLPWYVVYDLNNNVGAVEAGFEQATYAVVGFEVGSAILAPYLMRWSQFPRRGNITHLPEPRLATIYTLLGAACFLARSMSIGRVPTLGALIAVGTNAVLVGLCLIIWQSWREKRHIAFVGWLLLALSLPFFTVTFLGFLGLGVMLFISVFAFVASFMRPRWKLIVFAFFLAYLGSSTYATYIRDRDVIRQVVWYEDAPLSDRIKQLSLSLADIAWFNPFDPVHLYWIDFRLNMNTQVGAAVDSLKTGDAEYAAGSTLWWSVIGMIPRALWPGKPAIAGGSELVSRYTGLDYGDETSVGVGLVMEFYVNYGTASVFLGFLVLGVIITAVDEAAGRRLSRGDWRGFAFWFLPGLAMVNPGANSVVEVTTSVGAAVVAAYLVNNCLLPYSKGKKVLPDRKRLMDRSNAQNEIAVGGRD